MSDVRSAHEHSATPNRVPVHVRRVPVIPVVYRTGATVIWLVTFFGCWVYSIAHYGVQLGVGLGWLPSAVVATVVATLWPLLMVLVALAALSFWGAI